MDEERRIWLFLLDFINNPYGVAGLMGNLYAESRLEPTCTCPKKSSYLSNINRDKFINDSVAFGLVQWRYHVRKKLLWDFIDESTHNPIKYLGQTILQLNYLKHELEHYYKGVLRTLQQAKTVQEASDIVILKYEKPGNVTDTAKAKRAEYGKRYFDKYVQKGTSNMNDKYVETTAPNVNLRTGNGKEFGILVRIGIQGTRLKYVSTANNGWVAVVTASGRNVGWVDPNFVKEVNPQ